METVMHTGVECLVCFMQQALTTVKRSTKDEALQRQILLLTDKCGEIVFDKLLIQQLLAMGLKVTVSVIVSFHG